MWRCYVEFILVLCRLYVEFCRCLSFCSLLFCKNERFGFSRAQKSLSCAICYRMQWFSSQTELIEPILWPLGNCKNDASLSSHLAVVMYLPSRYRCRSCCCDIATDDTMNMVSKTCKFWTLNRKQTLDFESFLRNPRPWLKQKTFLINMIIVFLNT